MKYGISDAQLQEIINFIKEYPEVEEAALFGSRALGTYKEASDVDIALKGEKVTHSLAAKMKFNIEEDTYLPFFFDFVAYPLIDNEALKEHIDTKGIIIYRKGWRECKLGEVVRLIGGGTPKTTVKEYWNGDIPWLSVNDFNTGVKYVSKTEKTITKKGLDNSSTKILDIGDIIISARGTVGATAVLKHPMAFNQSCYGIKSIPGVTDQDFLYYLVKDSITSFQQIAHGGVFDTITRETFNAIDILLPPISEQRAIASVLSCLDDKIDLLHRQNKTLEAMAETLFRQWFVEEADEEWEEVELEYVCERITDGAHQSPPTTEIGMPMASVKDMHDWGFDLNNCRKISESDYQKLVRDDCRPLKNDILIAKDGSYLKHIFVVPEEMDLVILSSIAIIRPNGKYHPLLLTLLLKMDSTKDELTNIVTGAVIPRIVLKDFRKYKILLPPIFLQNKALVIIEPLAKKCWQNMKQIYALEKLRNTLLPRLMSGEVKIKA